MRKRRVFLAAAVVFLPSLHGFARAQQASSCPLSTRVAPLVEQTLPSYAVQLTDGRNGDLDGVVNGECEVELHACIGGSGCGTTTIGQVRVTARGRSIDVTPRAVAATLLDAFAAHPDALAPQSRSAVAFAADSLPTGACGVTRVRIAASSRAPSFALRLSTRGGADGPSTAHVRVRCLPDATDADDGPACFDANRKRCPGTNQITAPPLTLTTADATARTFYMSPNGSDAAAGTSRSAPLRTFNVALRKLAAGDTLVLLDGTYTRSTTDLPRIDCGTGSLRNAVSGTSSSLITIRAENERRAFLSSDGLKTAFEMVNCSWWRVEGLRAASRDNSSGEQTDGYPFRVHASTNVTLRRLLGSHNNRKHNTHVFAVEDSKNVLVEDCEAYYFHRHGFSIWKSYGVTLRRCYANSMRYGNMGCCSSVDNRPYGDSAFSLYGSSATIVENSVSENRANGFHISGMPNSLDPSGSGGRNNNILGSISLDDAVPALVSSRYVGGKYRNALGNVFRDFVSAKTTGNGLFLRGAANSVVENVTLYASTAGSGFVADGGDPQLGGTCGSSNSEGCGFTARNVLSIGNDAYGIFSSSQRSWRVERSNAIGNDANWNVGEAIGDTSGYVRQSLEQSPGPVGLGSGQCLMWIPAGSPMKGAGMDGRDIGATIVNRYENGTLTSTPLWNRDTGAFPCGAIVAGVNDGSIACSNLHRRLNVNTNGCRLP